MEAVKSNGKQVIKKGLTMAGFARKSLFWFWNYKPVSV